MKMCKRAWNVARRDRSDLIPADNPFAKMGLPYTSKRTRPVNHDELMHFVRAADEGGEGSLGTAAMIAFFWLQRQEDILGRLSRGPFRPADAPEIARVFHHKTGEPGEVSLYDTDGTALWPELMQRLDAALRRRTLIVTREQLDRRKRTPLPWRLDSVRHRFAAIREAAGIDSAATFMGLRHGGNGEGARPIRPTAASRAERPPDHHSPPALRPGHAEAEAGGHAETAGGENEAERRVATNR